MNTLKRYAYILEFLKNLEDAEIHKTFLQKAVYILQDGLKERLNYSYRLHFYGPFSQELAYDINVLNDMDLIDEEFDQNRLKYKIKITDKGKKFLETLKSHGVEAEKQKIKKVLSLISKRNMNDMELLGTVLYFSRLTGNKREVEKLVNMVKPHFTRSQISKALQKLKKNKLI